MKIPEEYITLDKFREITKDMPGDTVIVLSIDEEGNEYKIASDYNTICCFNDNSDPIDIYTTSELKPKDRINMMKCIILWPIG